MIACDGIATDSDSDCSAGRSICMPSAVVERIEPGLRRLGRRSAPGWRESVMPRPRPHQRNTSAASVRTVGRRRFR